MLACYKPAEVARLLKVAAGGDELADLREKQAAMDAQLSGERDVINEISQLKEKIDQTRLQIEQAEQMYTALKYLERKKQYENVPVLRNLVPAQVLAGKSSFNAGSSLSAGLPAFSPHTQTRQVAYAGSTTCARIRDGRLYANGPERALERILDIATQFAWALSYSVEHGLVHEPHGRAAALRRVGDLDDVERQGAQVRLLAAPLCGSFVSASGPRPERSGDRLQCPAFDIL